mgnify:CR=1 FL=1
MTISRMQQPRQMYQEGGIMPRLNQLGSGVSSAEQMLQGINQRLESAESSLGSGGGTLATSVQTPDPFFGKNPLFDGRLLGPGKIDNQGQDPLQIGKLGQIPEQFRSGFDEYLKNNETSFGFGGQALSSVGLPGGGSVTFGDTGSAGAFRDYLKTTGFNLPGGMGSPIQQAMMGRQMYGLGSLVKSITKPFKKVAKSVKKFALPAAALYFGSQIPIGSNRTLGSLFGDKISGILSSEALKKGMGKIGDTLLDVGVGSLVGGGLDYLQRSKLPQPEEKIKGRSRAEIDEVISGLEKNYENLGYEPGEIDLLVEQYINQNYPGYYRADGGRIGYARGDTAEQNAMQAAGIEGLPLNQNPAGITELDLRETGGFIPPVGVKEKADDIPAMLSNNEFVMTADAVREFGDGDVDKGAERMYAMMKTLENGGRV